MMMKFEHYNQLKGYLKNYLGNYGMINRAGNIDMEKIKREWGPDFVKTIFGKDFLNPSEFANVRISSFFMRPDFRPLKVRGKLISWIENVITKNGKKYYVLETTNMDKILLSWAWAHNKYKYKEPHYITVNKEEFLRNYQI